MRHDSCREFADYRQHRQSDHSGQRYVGVDMEENKPDLLGVAESLRQHSRPSQIAFMVYELLTTNDYTDEEILEVAAALEDIVC